MRWLPVLTFSVCSACAATSYDGWFDPFGHGERVAEDVSAMLEGMAAAHSGNHTALPSPGFRSNAPSLD